jgi:LPXTG-motif cell wall-anchored protein
MALSLLLALVPATAFADGAGDEQYQDPLSAPAAPKKPKKKAATTAPTSTSTTPAAATAPAATTAPASSPASSGASASARELPRTGLPAGAIGLAGLTLIASGAVLRRRTAAE